MTFGQTADNYVAKNSILPTFTGVFHSKNLIRVMRDTGAQSNFIRSDLANRENLNKIGNVRVTVKGFNTSREYDSSVVEVPLKFGPNWFTLHAICIDEIKTTLELPGLSKLARILERKGYKLADCEIINSNDYIENIGFVLGSESAHILPENWIKFNNNSCALPYNDIGLVLIGRLDLLMSNIDFFPDNNRVTPKIGIHSHSACYTGTTVNVPQRTKCVQSEDISSWS